MTFLYNDVQELNQAVVELHNVARTIEQHLGVCRISIAVRRCADDLVKELHPVTDNLNSAKGE